MSEKSFFNSMPLYSRFAWISELALMCFFLIICFASVQHNVLGVALVSGVLAIILLQFCSLIFIIEFIKFRTRIDKDVP